MKVNVNMYEPIGSYKFASIILSYEYEEIKTEVELLIDYRNIYEFTTIHNGITLDLFLISSIVYGIDILLPRSVASDNNWNREIEVIIPVENAIVFNDNKRLLNDTLTFLTGDLWNLSFEKSTLNLLYQDGKRSKLRDDTIRRTYKVVNLFSGGMDSLIGAINQLTNSKDRLLLVSHCDSIFKGARSDQDALYSQLCSKFQNFSILQTNVSMSKWDVNGNRYQKETTLRSRSFLFMSMAVLIANAIDHNLQINIPENGTISLNYPLTPSRKSSCSTRTTHPHFLILYNMLLKSLGIDNHIVNPYQFKTKGEMVKECLDVDFLKSTYSLSCSCGKRGTRKDIRDNPHVHNCGVCMPCIYRRCALSQIGENEVVGTDIFNPIKRAIKDIPDMPALIDYLSTDYKQTDIEEGLLVNGTLPIDLLPSYAHVVMRTRNELKEWIKTYGGQPVSKIFGI